MSESARTVMTAPVVMRGTDRSRLAGHAAEALSLAESATSGRLSAEDAERLFRAAASILAILTHAAYEPAEVVDLAAERARRR